MRLAAALAALALCACARPAETPAPAPVLSLDCALSYEDLSRAVLAQPGLVQAPKEPGEPYRFYRNADSSVAYVFTEAGAPGHPAILMQKTVRDGGARRMDNSGCPYGDKAGFAQVLAYLGSLS